MQAIYLDCCATTPILPEVAEAIHACQRSGLANPASAHAAGRRARQLLEDAREGIAEILGLRLAARPADRLIFTSGGTEANNLALGGLAPGARVAVSAIEHPSVKAAAERRAGHGGECVSLPVTAHGVVDLAAADELLVAPLGVASVQWCNHETGAVQPVAELAAQCAERGVLLHVDAAQAVGKLPVDFSAAPWAALSLAAHKFHGPVGIGALALRGDVALEPLLVGGAQQLGHRAGTESVALAVGMHEALCRAQQSAEQRGAHLRELQSRFEALLGDQAAPLVVHTERVERAPHVSMVAFPGLQREALLMALDLEGVGCSAGSACASGSSEPSPTLRAMGVQEELLRSSLRFSWGCLTTLAEVEEAARRISRTVNRLRAGNLAAEGGPTHRVSAANSVY